MSLPTFLGIGVQKAGTSWLHYNLSRHPEIFVPTLRKEIHFFDRYYSKGAEWYKGFFPDDASGVIKQFGEITPRYIVDKETPERILRELGPIKIIVILRDPVERFFSQYRMSYSKGEINLTPNEILESSLDAFERGLYSSQLKRYINCFGRENILILFYEEVFSNGEKSTIDALHRVGEFLEVCNDKWPLDNLNQPIGSRGSSGRPNYFGIYRVALKFRKWCMDADIEWLVFLIKKMGVSKSSFGETSNTPTISYEHKMLMWEKYKSDVKELEVLLGKNLDFWGPNQNN
jgi:Sulfotransferase domain